MNTATAKPSASNTTNAVMIDLNTFVWVSRGTLLGGARFSATASLLVSNNSLASDTKGQLSAGGGFADFYLQPFILGWQRDRLGIRAAYGVLAPTGRFNAGASDNVGSGYWTHAPSSGVTVFLTADKKTTPLLHLSRWRNGFPESRGNIGGSW